MASKIKQQENVGSVIDNQSDKRW